MSEESFKKEEWLREKYHGEGLTTTEIGEIFGVTSATISYWMDKHDIETKPRSQQGPSAEERFWEKVEKRGPEECWIWTGATKRFGYGNFWTGERYEGAHRVSYRLENGEIDGKNVLHHCDTPGCVNPSHLYTGTYKQNAADREERNPWDRSGENAGRAKLTEDQVAEIRKRLSNTTEQELADEYGVSRSTISHISLGHNWGEE
jgi:DNA-binding transcriptional regulator YiaG